MGTHVQRGRVSDKAKGRFHFPFQKISKPDCLKLGKGFIRTAIQVDEKNQSNCVASQWVDNKSVHFLGTVNVQPSKVSDVTLRKESKAQQEERSKRGVGLPGCQKIPVNSHQNINDYNKFMGGVDRLDQLFGLEDFGCKSTRWYMRIVHWLINLVITQIYIYCKLLQPKPANSRGIEHRYFESFDKLPVGSKHHMFLLTLAVQLVDVANQPDGLPTISIT